ncbi:hypothetical protein O6H91_09G099000 [Diphasiastrum complanatum]|uniref:Uncharacterized protein n=1 Tax=Diphasiastrum complanatum TaxID=34168 RepID=A0ACC2CS77_DIPCM|nr:hypothetical protein O6H91_09G099000 [Diphasiastrum complanatum]
MAGALENSEPLEYVMQILTSQGRRHGETKLLDLPSVVLVSVLTRISDPVDVACVLCSCRFLRTVTTSVDFFLKLRPWNTDESYEEVARSRLPGNGLGAWTRAALAGIRTQMPCTRVLDVAGCGVLDEDVSSVLADLRGLECLILDGCQKLTSAVADALAVSVRSGPQALSLQRCFRLGPTAAGNLLAAAAADGSRLHCILLSHLDRLDLPRESPLLDVQENNTVADIVVPVRSLENGNSGLRILALHNCGSLGAFELATMAATCPLLEFLLLGGSGEGLGLCRAEALNQEMVDGAVAALLSLANSLKNLKILEITFFTFTVYQTLREHVRKGVQIWDLCDENTALLVASIIGGSKMNKFGMLSRAGTAGYLQDSLHRYYTDHYLYACPTQRTTKILEIELGQAILALRAAANCVDIRKRTPLHVAASLGNHRMVSSLLAIGALTAGMKDSAGATALFIAAECGHALVCELLLKGGANALAMNRAGETPLYIAALRGHCAAVESMLLHCKKHDVNWQDADAYGLSLSLSLSLSLTHTHTHIHWEGVFDVFSMYGLASNMY